MEREKRIFISHSSVDHPATRASVKALEQCGFKVWYYEENQEYGDLRRLIEDAPHGVQICGALLSRAAIASVRVSQEIAVALALEQQHGFLIVPIRIEPGCRVPMQLNLYRRLDFTTGTQWAELQTLCVLSAATGVSGCPCRRQRLQRQTPPSPGTPLTRPLGISLRERSLPIRQIRCIVNRAIEGI